MGGFDQSSTAEQVLEGGPALGALVCMALVVVRVATGDWQAPAIAGVLLLGAVLIYAAVRPKTAPATPAP